jgi:uncharacterized protein (TIRG00374 family)
MPSSPQLTNGSMKWIARSVLAGVLVLGLFYFVSARELLSALSQVSLRDICILLALSFLLIGVSVVKWRLFLQHLGISSSLRKLFGLYLVGYFVNVFAPSFIGGDVVRSLALGPKVNRAHAVSATALERYTGVVAMLAMALVACCVSSVVTHEIVLVVVTAATGCALVTWLLFSGWLNVVARKVPLPAKVVRIVETVHEGLVLGVNDRRLLVRALALSLVFHLLTIINTAAVGTAVGWAEIPLGGLLVVVPLILLVGAVPISPQGLGIQEGAFVFFLHSVGATTSQALAIALVLRAKSYLLALCGGAVWLLNRDLWKRGECPSDASALQ